MDRIKFALIPIFLLLHASAMGGGLWTPTDHMMIGSMLGSFYSVPLLILPIALLVKFRANIQSTWWSLLTLAMAWAGGALSMGATCAIMFSNYDFTKHQQINVMGGVALLVMTALTMIMYRIRVNRVAVMIRSADVKLQGRRGTEERHHMRGRAHR